MGPNVVRGKQSLLACYIVPIHSKEKTNKRLDETRIKENFCQYSRNRAYIDTCSKKIQSEIIMQIKTVLRAIFKN